MLKRMDQWKKFPGDVQKELFEYLVKSGAETYFGREHNFDSVTGYESFRRFIPLRDYQSMAPYIDRVRDGDKWVLWNGDSNLLVKKEGKLIPVTREGLKDGFFKGMKLAIAGYVEENPETRLLSGRNLTVGAMTPSETFSGNFIGDLPAVLMHGSSFFSEFFRIPKKEIAFSADFDDKVKRICREYSGKKNVTGMCGSPEVMATVVRSLLEFNNTSSLTDFWPDFELFTYDAVQGIEKYRRLFDSAMSSTHLRYMGMWYSPEGFFGFQDDLRDNSLLLALDCGIFYEFIPEENLQQALADPDFRTLTIDEVEKGVRYSVVISNTSGLWRYMTGYVVEFASLYPHKVKVVDDKEIKFDKPAVRRLIVSEKVMPTPIFLGPKNETEKKVEVNILKQENVSVPIVKIKPRKIEQVVEPEPVAEDQTVQGSAPVPEPVPVAEPELEPQPAPDPVADPVSAPVVELEPESVVETAPAPVVELTPEPAPEPMVETVPEPAPESEPEPAPTPEPVAPAPTVESEPELAPEPAPEPKPTPAPKPKSKAKPKPKKPAPAPTSGRAVWIREDEEDEVETTIEKRVETTVEEYRTAPKWEPEGEVEQEAPAQEPQPAEVPVKKPRKKPVRRRPEERPEPEKPFFSRDDKAEKSAPKVYRGKPQPQQLGLFGEVLEEPVPEDSAEAMATVAESVESASEAVVAEVPVAEQPEVAPEEPKRGDFTGELFLF